MRRNRDTRSSRRGIGAGRERRFKYKSRSVEQVKKRGERQGGSRDSIILDKYSFFKVNKGNNRIRILPRTWDKPMLWEEDDAHYGLDVWVHYGIGTEKNTYLCLEKLKNQECPICEEYRKAVSEGDLSYASNLKPKQRVFYWLIDRDNEDEGVQLWPAPWTIDRDISKLSYDSRTGELLKPDEPDENGYDVEFDYTPPKGVTPGSYDAVQIARRPSPLGNEDWLDFVVDNPIPNCLNFYDTEYIEKVFLGEKKEDDDNNRDIESNVKIKEDKYTYDDIQNMRRSKLEELAIDDFDFSEEEIGEMSIKELRKEICQELELEEENDSERRLRDLKKKFNKDEDDIPF